MQKARSQQSSRYLKRRRWTERDARQALAALEQSSLPVSVFAKQMGLSAMRLFRWRRRLRVEAPLFEEITYERTEPAESEPVVRKPEHGSFDERERIEIVVGVDHRVRVPNGFKEDALRQILRLLHEMGEERRC